MSRAADEASPEELGPSSEVRHSFLRWLFLLPLVVPSLFLFLFTPPLWRDADGYFQLKQRPAVSTILHWPPAYCFGARAPLWVGTVIGATAGVNPAPAKRFFRQPNITEGGIYGVIVFQHLLLLATLAWIITQLSPSPLVRFLLGLLAMWQEPLFVYAHTIGSESLSNILVFLFLMMAWQFVARRGGRDLLGWGLAGGVLFLLLLTRHINAVLCSTIPLYFLGIAFLSLFAGNLRWTPPPWFASLRAFALGIAVGLAAIFLSQAFIWLLCQANDIPFRSRIGYTFQWRLRDIQDRDASTQRAIWNRVEPALAAHPDIQGLLAQNGLADGNPSADPLKLDAQLQSLFHARFPDQSEDEIRALADRELNALAKAFIRHAGLPFWQLVWQDSWQGWQWSLDRIAAEPFYTTAYFAQPGHREKTAAREVQALPSYQRFLALGAQKTLDANPYLRLPHLSVGALFLLTFAASLLLLFVGGAGRDIPAGVFGLAALGSGILLWTATKLLTEQLPRFILPTYCIIAFVLLFTAASIAETFRRRSRLRAD